MDANDQSSRGERRSSDVILFQRVGGGWEFRYTSSAGETYTAFAYDWLLAKARLFKQLGWDQLRFGRAEFRRF
jgi:hypothetical protein